MTENYDIPAANLKIIDAPPVFSILFCNSAFFRKITNPILRPATLPKAFTDFPLQRALTPHPFPDISQTSPPCYPKPTFPT